MSRLSYGLERSEKIEAHSTQARMIENARRNAIRREMEEAAPFEFTARGFLITVALASAAASLAAFTSI